MKYQARDSGAMATPPPVAAPRGTEVPPPGQGVPPFPYQYPYPPPVYYYQQPPKKSDSNTIITVVVVLVVVLVVVPAVIAFAIFSSFPGWGNPYYPPNPGPTKNIGVACVRTNATSWKCVVASADAGVDFSQVSVEIRDSSGGLIGKWPSPIEYQPSSGSLLIGSASTPLSSSARLVDNGDGMWGVGDDAYLSPVQGSTLAGCTFVLEGMGGRGQVTIG